MPKLNSASKHAIVIAVIVVAVAIAAVVAYFVTQGTGDATVESGGACSVNTDCEGFAFLQPDSLSCCNGTCQKLYADWVGIGFCGTVFCSGRTRGPQEQFHTIARRRPGRHRETSSGTPSKRFRTVAGALLNLHHRSLENGEPPCYF